MATTEERMKILKMVEEGKVSPEDGAKLLAALSESAGNKAGSSAGASSGYANIRSAGGARWLRIRVTDIATGKQKVSVNLPIGLVSVGAKIAAKFAPEAESLEINQIVEAIKSGAQGKIIDVLDDEDGEHVEIYVE
ncbi:MAG: hypothetical protein RMN52_01720 [Anaerolineae bacterium]|nr:hypothetical protein [Candidatus Roseilinea sp.]MDW8448697.1 hypothetical protein [Anaerolineae bacterium]